jgi:hypothetical protein
LRGKVGNGPLWNFSRGQALDRGSRFAALRPPGWSMQPRKHRRERPTTLTLGPSSLTSQPCRFGQADSVRGPPDEPEHHLE